MTAPPSGSPNARDAEHLKLLGIFHFVYAGIQGLVGLLFLIYIGLGVLVLNRTIPSTPPPAGSHELPPQFFGWLFIVIGTVALLWAEAIAVMNLLAGRYVRARRHRVFLLVTGALNCMWVPFGTVLGVFDFIVLSREGVRRLFDGEAS